MSEIHFDQEGEPVELHADCAEVRWRHFPNPGTRGAPRIVHDRRNHGAPLYTPGTIAYVEFHDRVDGVSGLYRGDQVDEHRRLIPGAKPFYVNIAAAPRNAGGGTADDLVRHLVESNTRQSETLITQLAGVMREQRKAMKETRKLVRVIATADLRDLLKRTEPTKAEDDENDDDEAENDEESIDGDGGWMQMLRDVATQVQSTVEMVVLERQAQRDVDKATAPAAVPTTTTLHNPPPPTPTPASPAPATAPAAPPSSAPAPTAPPSAPAPAAPPPSATPAATAASSPPASAPPPSDVRNAASATPTPEQYQHLLRILGKLSPAEREIVKGEVRRMPNAERMQWLVAVCAMSVDDAAVRARLMIQQKEKES